MSEYLRSIQLGLQNKLMDDSNDDQSYWYERTFDLNEKLQQ